MTAAFPPPITCPSSLVASCAPLLGFTPDNCLVAFVHGVPGRPRPVIVRVDLPPLGAAIPTADHTARSIAGTGAAAADLIAWIPEPDDTLRGDLSSTPLLTALHEALAYVGVELTASLSTNGRVWWSHTCSDPICCPQDATAVDQGVADAVRAEYVYAGYAPLASRAQLARRVAQDEGRSQAVQQAVTRISTKPSPRWRRTAIRFLTDLLLAQDGCAVQGGALSAARTARLLRALADVGVRDVVLHRLAVAQRPCPDCWNATLETLCEALRAAPRGHIAPVATIAALVAWMRGEGALATLCLQRADKDPPYRLARLAQQLIASGVDPSTWRASLAGLSEAQCLDLGRP